MTRRIVRTSIQLGTLTLIVLLLVFLLDNRFNVLPDAIHNALPAHHPGLVITDITIATCSTLNILSSCKLDAAKWHRVEKDLYLKQGWLTHAFIHIERKREAELSDKDQVILDVRVSEQDPVTSEKDQGAERWESRPGGIWLKRTAKHRESDNHEAVTAVDVLFGTDAVEVRPGWKMSKQSLTLPNSDGGNQPSYLSARHGPPVNVEKEKPTLHVNKDGKFKILQAADLHLATGPGVCRDPEPPLDNGGVCNADSRTLHFLNSVLDSEKPDLVILSGDQINGETAPDAQSAVFKFVHPIVQRKIPFAAIFGNHDDEGSLSREALMQLTESLPYSLSQAGNPALDGVGNYFIEVLARGGSSHSALTLFLLDTHAYSPDQRQFRGYDWIKKNQIDWFKSTSRDLKNSPSHKGYHKTHMDMAFIHIPLPEYRDDIVLSTGKKSEESTAPAFNSGFKDALVEEGILAVSCGHDHVNDYCSLAKDNQKKPQLWMCYAGGSGFGGYGGYGGYHRRLRVFEFDFNEVRLVTWKRLEYGQTEEKLDKTILVEGGHVIGPKA